MEEKSEFSGKICTEFYDIDDEDRIVWIQRALITMGIALDDYDVESEDDLIGIFDTLIEENAVAMVQVTESGMYTNIRVKRRLDSDDFDLVEADAALAGKVSDDDDDDDDDEKWEVGDEVKFDDKNGNTHEGTIKKIDDDDEEARVKVGKKTHTVALDELESNSDDDDEDDEIEKGDTVKFTIGKGKKAEEIEGEVKKVDGDELTVKVGKKSHKVDASDCELVDDDDDDDDNSDDDDDDGDDSFEKGDEVKFTVGKGKKKEELEGTIKKIDGDEATVKVGKKSHKVDVSDLEKVEEQIEYEVDDVILVKKKKHVITKVDSDKEFVMAKPSKGKGKAVKVKFEDVEYEVD